MLSVVYDCFLYLFFRKDSMKVNMNQNILVIYYYHFTLCELFLAILTDRFSLKSEWQEVSTGLHDI